MSRRTSVEAHADPLDIVICGGTTSQGSVKVIEAVVDLVLGRVTFRVVADGRIVVTTLYLGLAVGAYNAIGEEEP